MAYELITLAWWMQRAAGRGECDDVDDSSSTEATTASNSSPVPTFLVTEPVPSILTAPLTAHFTALSAHSTLQQLHSIQRSSLSSTELVHSGSSSAPLYRLTTTNNTHKRQKRQQQPPPHPSLSSSTQPAAEQPLVEYVLAFHTAASISLPLLSYVVAQLRTAVLVALVDSGQSVTVLRLQSGIVPHSSHGQQKKGEAVVAVQSAGGRRAAAAVANKGQAVSSML